MRSDAAKTGILKKAYFDGILQFVFIGSHSSIPAVQQAHPQKPRPQIKGPKTLAMA